MLFKNFITAPFFTKCMSLLVSSHSLASLSDPLDSHMPTSTYSFSFLFIKRVKGWDTDNITEDWHILIKNFFETHGKLKVEPIFLPTNAYSVESDNSYFESLTARWIQAKRHSWAVFEMSYFLQKLHSSPKFFLRSLQQFWRTFSLGYAIFIPNYMASLGLYFNVLGGKNFLFKNF
jgi:hypothetical protein